MANVAAMAEAAVARDYEWFKNHFQHESHQEVPVSNLLAEAKNALHDVLEKLESVDENTVAALETAKDNPVAVSIINTVLSVAHLPDEDSLLTIADSALKGFAAVLQKGAAATAPAVTAPSTTAQPVPQPAATANAIR